MWSAVTFGGVFGIADDEAQMAEVMVIAPFSCASENPQDKPVRCEPKWGEHGWKRCIT